MIESLIVIGSELNKTKPIISIHLGLPKEEEDKTALPVILNLDKLTLEVEKERLHAYDKNLAEHEFPILAVARESKIGTATAIKSKEFAELKNILEAFSGKKELRKMIQEAEHDHKKYILELLDKISSISQEEWKKIDPKLFKEDEFRNLVFLYTKLRIDGVEHHWQEIAGFREIIEQSLSGGQNIREGISYLTGKKQQVSEFGISRTPRYSLIRMFVTSTHNYLNNFDSNKAYVNFQAEPKSVRYMELASSYLLRNYQVRIAGMNHVIVPEWRLQSGQLIEDLEEIQKGSELLFEYNQVENFELSLGEETGNQYWINYLGFESDGNSFKTISLIKRISKSHFFNIIKKINFINNLIEKHIYYFPNNLLTIYLNIPHRKDKQNISPAYPLFKSLFESRVVKSALIFKFYVETILAHRFKRYATYKNLQHSKNEDFEKDLQNTTSTYMALLLLLNKLNLRTQMEKSPQEHQDTFRQMSETQNKAFFEAMDYTPQQEALFFLGRALKTVAYYQEKEKNYTNRPILEKVNFNGMKRLDIQRLYCDLHDKKKQYNIHDKLEGNLSRFAMRFDFNNWSMFPEEALFFLLTGYSFVFKKSEETPKQESDSPLESLNESENN